MLVYATVGDLAAWMSNDVPDNATALLRSASLLIGEETKAAYYLTDDTGLPTDATLLQAFSDAACAQAAVWIGLGVDPNLLGLDVQGPVKSSSILGGTVTRDTSAASSMAAFASRQQAAADLCPEAARILRQAGLLTSRVWTYG